MIKMTVQKNLIGLEDLLVGVGTVEQNRGPSTDDPVTITKINGGNMPYDEDYSMQEKFDMLQAQIDNLPQVVDEGGNLLTGLINTSNLDLNLAGRLWRKTIDANEAQIFYGSVRILSYHPTTGGIILPEDTDYIAADAVVTAAFQAADDALETAYVAADAVVTAAFEAADSDLQDQIDDAVADIAAIGGGVPIGTIIQVAYTTVDTGYLKCNGQAVSRTTYADLFAKISTTYGVGDGSTTFNVPDLRGEFIRGWDDGREVDSARGIGTFQADSTKAHTHGAGTLATDTAGNHTHQLRDWSGGGGVVSHMLLDLNPNAQENNWDLIDVTQPAGAHSHTITGSTASSGSAETRPRNVALMYLIKAL